MSDTWYYAEADKPVGPISLEELKRVLPKKKDWRKKLVWNASFGEWREAGAVAELDIVEPPPVPKRQAKPKWWWRAASLAVTLIVFALAKTFSQELFRTFHQPSASPIEEALTLAESKAQVPQKINEMTTIVAVKHTGTKELTYFYEVNTKDFDIQPGFIVPLRKAVAPKACSQMEEALSLGVVLVYRYRDQLGKELGQFALNQNDCSSR